MPRKSTFVEVGKRKLEISNLDKVLYPKKGVVKAEVIEYYLRIAPTILRHIKRRPLSLIRFPDGIHGEQFFQKDRPKWAPDWIEYTTLGEDKPKDYILATEEATLVWLANLACLEIHQMHSRMPDRYNPDYIVFDLDPPDDKQFTVVRDLAFDLKDHIEGYGYTCFVKTTGGKGVHVVYPVEPRWDFHACYESALDIATPFVEKFKKTTTLAIRKDARKGKVLIDIYRNRQSQTIISPYSMRGIE